ncbi:hypothetical protein [Gordonia sp. NB41Y]|uniref:hypothetical protein n=1 Tax=Gordonia sp. NB41Y TaxID=875808 RepID=UPI0006B1C433|nr:hypothetical protein [Gordonia sp. NB41Y]KOY49790.1 hypothetical protein ISGA_07985 [Gordonia sp. NB41Y]WLP90826.1 hypothetical protein Q9K23_00530 [Gordonia sp. NB41Y]
MAAPFTPDHLGTGLIVDIAPAVSAVVAAASAEAARCAAELIGADPADPTGTDPATPDVHADAKALATQLVRLRIELAAGLDPIDTVVVLRRGEVTWAAIAQAAGTSRQAAHERWGRRVREELDGQDSDD